MTSTTSDIARLVIAGQNGNALIDRIHYSVPEPDTLALLAFGLVGVVVSARRRSQASGK